VGVELHDRHLRPALGLGSKSLSVLMSEMGVLRGAGLAKAMSARSFIAFTSTRAALDQLDVPTVRTETPRVALRIPLRTIIGSTNCSGGALYEIARDEKRELSEASGRRYARGAASSASFIRRLQGIGRLRRR
jgi:hypothetical protein